MTKQELLEYLLNHIDYFKEVSLEDFCRLASLEPCELGLMNYDNYQVTSLLQQICNYALVDTNLSQEDKEDIENYLSSHEEQQFLDDALDVANKCYQYVDIMLENGANHPCLKNINNLINGAFLYTEIAKIVCKLIENTSDQFQNDLIYFGNIIDEKIMDITDSIWNDLLKTIENKKITSGIDLLNNISNYIKQILVIAIFVPLNQSHTYCMEDTYIHFLTKEKIHPEFKLSIGDCIRSLSIIAKKVHKYQEYDDDTISQLIEDLEEGYYVYNSYRYLYLKNQYQESKMIEKCKKM